MPNSVAKNDVNFAVVCTACPQSSAQIAFFNSRHPKFLKASLLPLAGWPLKNDQCFRVRPGNIAADSTPAITPAVVPTVQEPVIQ